MGKRSEINKGAMDVAFAFVDPDLTTAQVAARRWSVDILWRTLNYVSECDRRNPAR